MSGRSLHFVLKIANRGQNIEFFKNILGMKVLRHEEFKEQCKASCNGPYDGVWSKTMVGFGPEDQHFVLELTYNYGISGYQLGNDLIYITIESEKVIENIRNSNYQSVNQNGLLIVNSPDGYRFAITSSKTDKISKVSLSSSNLNNSLKYWQQLLDMKLYEKSEKSFIVGYDESQCKLELIDIKENVNHEKAFGRIAFSCPENQLKNIESKMKSENQTILTPLVSLETPGKETVQVVILADPDGHEICFVGDQAFRTLSQFDIKADQLLSQALARDKSDDWFEKKGISKVKA